MNRKHNILITLFLLFTVSGLWAQDKYEYATLTYSSYPNVVAKNGVISVSKSKSYEEVAVSVEQGSLITNFSPVIQYLETMSNDGWELISVIKPDNFNVTYHLRKKKI